MPMASMTIRDDSGDEVVCDLCGESHDKWFRVVSIEYGYRISRCRKCNLVQLRPKPREIEDVNEVYWTAVDLSDPVVQDGRKSDLEVVEGVSALLERNYDFRYEHERILDVGPGMGEFLDYVKARGGRGVGVDVSRRAIEYINNNCDVEEVYVGEFERLDIPQSSFALVTGWNILEHVTSPTKWLTKANEVLVPGGLVLVKVPNVVFSGAATRAGPLLRLVGHNAPGGYLASRPPLHIHGFSKNTLERIFRHGGFEDVRVFRAPLRSRVGRKWKLVSLATKLATASTLGMKEFHPVLMAIGRKPMKRQ